MVNPACGWNTWNYETLTALSYVDGDRVEIELRVSVFDEERVEHVRDIRWRDLVRLGPHAFDGSCLLLEFQAGFEARFELEAAACGRCLALRIRPTRTSAKRVVIEIHRPGRSHDTDRWTRGMRIGEWRIAADGTEQHGTFCVASGLPTIVGRPGGEVRVAAAPAEDGEDAALVALSKVPDRLACAAAHHADAFPAGTGELQDAMEAMQRAAAWNTVYDLGGRGVCTTASRDWCKDWRGVVLFGWDTFFHGMIAGLFSPETAWANYAAALAGTTEAGFVPNWRLSSGAATLDRSQPPVGAYCVWKTFLRHPDLDRLAELYPALLRWHEWWTRARMTPEGLPAWGSDAGARYAFPELRQRMFGAQICCCYESGMDNSPMFDGVPYDIDTGLMEQADVGLAALLTVDALCLSRMAAVLRRHDESARLSDEACSLQLRMDTLLWDDATGIYRNRRADGSLSKRVSPTSFYPLLCGPAPARVRRMVDEHLLSPARFWGVYPLPSVPHDDPDFRDNDYWRGRIWAPMVALVYDGLRACGLDDVASELARRSVKMLVREWRSRSAVYENYNAVTGEGADVANADPLYVWGGLPAYAALQELVDVRDSGIYVGSASDVTASVRNLRVRGSTYEVSTGPDGLRVVRDGQPIVSTASPERVLLPFDV